MKFTLVAIFLVTLSLALNVQSATVQQQEEKDPLEKALDKGAEDLLGGLLKGILDIFNEPKKQAPKTPEAPKTPVAPKTPEAPWEEEKPKQP